MITWARFKESEPLPGPDNRMLSTMSTDRKSRDFVGRIFIDGFMLCAEFEGELRGYPLSNVRSVRYASDEPKKAKPK